MAKRLFIFKEGRTEVVLPVSPESYTVTKENHIETLNIHELGDVNVSGYQALDTIELGCIYPAQYYSFAGDIDAEALIRKIDQWVKSQRRVRFIVGGTDVNIPVLIESHSYGEKDGTNDIYAKIRLRQHVQLAEPTYQSVRPPIEKKALSDKVQKVGKGDTLSSKAWENYGSTSEQTIQQLMKANKISKQNAPLTHAQLKVPARIAVQSGRTSSWWKG